MLYGVSGREFDVSREKFFLEAISGKQTVETVDLPYYKDYPAIVFTSPVIYDGSIKSFVSLIYSTEVLCELVEDITFGNEGYGYIIDSKGFTCT